MRYISNMWLDAYNVVDVPVANDAIVRQQRAEWEARAQAAAAQVQAALQPVTVESVSRPGVSYPSLAFLQGHG